jgi:hypothetical protein
VEGSPQIFFDEFLSFLTCGFTLAWTGHGTPAVARR